MDVKWLPPASLTPARRPQSVGGEVERFITSGVDLEPEENPALPALKNGLLYLTTHRLVWVDDASPTGFSIPLACVTRVYPVKKSIRHFTASPRVRLQVSVSPDGRVDEKGTKSEIITVILRGGKDSDSFFGRLEEVRGLRSWEVGGDDEGTSLNGGRTGEGSGSLRISMPVVGITGLLRKEQEMWESTDKSLQDAFKDLDALMTNAREMVKLAEKMRQKLLSGSNHGNSSNDDDLGSKQEMQDWLLSVGIASPVTKESAGALYHQQLARQLADFTQLHLGRHGGMMAVIDVYCLFNRARGTELISPEDLLQACSLWEKFDVSVMLRQFDSGVMVIQSKSHSDDEVFARIDSLVRKPDVLSKGVTASDAAITLGIAPALAKEHLLAAESKGLLCRDISPEGFRFYVNIFKEINPKDIYRSENGGLLSSWASAAFC